MIRNARRSGLVWSGLNLSLCVCVSVISSAVIPLLLSHPHTNTHCPQHLLHPYTCEPSNVPSPQSLAAQCDAITAGTSAARTLAPEAQELKLPVAPSRIHLNSIHEMDKLEHEWETSLSEHHPVCLRCCLILLRARQSCRVHLMNPIHIHASSDLMLLPARSSRISTPHFRTLLCSCCPSVHPQPQFTRRGQGRGQGRGQEQRASASKTPCIALPLPGPLLQYSLHALPSDESKTMRDSGNQLVCALGATSK